MYVGDQVYLFDFIDAYKEIFDSHEKILYRFGNFSFWRLYCALLDCWSEHSRSELKDDYTIKNINDGFILLKTDGEDSIVTTKISLQDLVYAVVLCDSSDPDIDPEILFFRIMDFLKGIEIV